MIATRARVTSARSAISIKSLAKSVCPQTGADARRNVTMKIILPLQGRLRVEQLEARALPSTVVLNAGVLTITGTNLRDEVEVYRPNSTTLAVWDSGKVTTF